MRYALVIALAAACNSKSTDAALGPTDSSRPVPAATKAAAADPARLAVHHVRLLQPEAVIEQRVSDSDGLAAAFKAAASAVITYDASHPDALPAELDLVVVARPNALRCWLVGPNGDLVVSELDSAFGKLPKVDVREGNVAAVQTLARTGISAAPRNPYLPAAWKAVAAQQGSEIDYVIDASWPRQ